MGATQQCLDGRHGSSTTPTHRCTWTNQWCPVRVFRQKFTLEDAIGSHTCSPQANMRVTNGILLECPLLLPVGTVNCVQTLKAHLVVRSYCVLQMVRWPFFEQNFGTRGCYWIPHLLSREVLARVQQMAFLSVVRYTYRCHHQLCPNTKGEAGGCPLSR
jgi:hypothetical protein